MDSALILPSPTLACHDCDALYTAPAVAEGEKIVCARCGARLFARWPNALQRATALVCASAWFFV
ncbi:MAG: paraquat-inducible protein A, partial [Verrucomicrobia bacterium]|nr:paraquat-inducible protein A [Verrucomicrobiota bacterium]